MTVLDDLMTEARWMRIITDYAQLTGWCCYHTHDSRRSPAGFPDLVLCRRGRLIVAELKTATGALAPAQRDWLEQLAAVPCLEVHTWRPRDWQEVRNALD